VVALLVALALAVTPFKATLTAPTHMPKVNTHWVYTVRATDRAGHPIAARVTVQTIDPFGLAHPVQYANTKQDIVNRPFKGVFRDFAVWPSSSRGFTLTLRAIVKARGSTVTLNYRVTPK
jgi:hypothetical protein